MIPAASSGSVTQQARRVLEHFDASSRNWEAIYSDSGVRAAVVKNRHALALDWIRELHDAADARILEIGCGAGLLSVALAQLGYAVEALDASERMVDRSRAQAAKLGLDRMNVDVGDANALAFGDEVFDLVVALGLLPWLHSPGVAIREMARVVATNGVVLVSADNRLALHRVLDPRFTPVLEPINVRIKRYLERKGLWKEAETLDARSHTPRAIDRMASQAGLEKVRSQTLGFGPFSLFGRFVLPDSLGVKLDRRLQCLSDRGTPAIRSGGHQYMLLARKALSTRRETGPAPDPGAHAESS
jgi:2-polyprenyl-3-methyl-5-hydroxy-6-metoxy-1,4-benzoquinol methylase